MPETLSKAIVALLLALFAALAGAKEALPEAEDFKAVESKRALLSEKPFAG